MPWMCEWCLKVFHTEKDIQEHAGWHIEFLISQQNKTALKILEQPIPFVKVGEDDE